jgi:TonB family protein
VSFSLSPARCCWLASAGAHAVIVAVGGHAALAPGAAIARTAQERVIDVIAADPIPEPVEPARPATVARAAGAASQPTHTHPYPVPPDHDAHPHDPSLVHVPLLPSSAPPPEVLAATDATPRFTMTISARGAAVKGATDSPDRGAPAEAEEARGSDSNPFAEEGVTSPARLVGAMSPVYPPEARANEVEADVALILVVSASGTVLDARVVKPAGFGFDDAALKAVRAARFTPALRNGRGVAVRMRWAVSFRLQ